MRVIPTQHWLVQGFAMSAPFNRVGRGEALKRLFNEKNGLSSPPSNSELTLGNPQSPSGGRGALFKSSNAASKSADTSATHSNGYTGPESNVTHAPAGAGRAKVFQQRISSDGRSSQAPSTNGLLRSQTTYVEEHLPSLHLADDTSEQDNPPVTHMGTSGVKATAVTNYFRLDIEPEKGIYMYDVNFQPDIDSLGLRKKLMIQLSDVLKDTRSFDGTLLFLPFELGQKVTNIATKSHDGTPVNVKVTLVKKMKMADREALHLYNIIFKRIMNILGLVLDGGKYTDPKAAQSMGEHLLEVWPGFVTAVQEFEDGVMLLCNSSYRVLNKQTVYELMDSLIRASKGDEWKETLSNMMTNQTVLTRYNNKTYRIDEVVYDASPMDTFMRKGEPITYFDYYQQHYDIKIRDKGQPLIRGIQNVKVKGREYKECIDLIPELCFLSGITDAMRNDNKVMKSIIQYSRVSPAQRQQALERFLTRIHSNPEASQLLSNWGLRLCNKNLKLPGRVLNPEPVIFGQEVVHPNTNYECEWNRSAMNNPVLSAVALESWVILCQRRDEVLAKEFVRTCKQVSPKMGIEIRDARIIQLRDDNTQSYIQELRKLKIQQVQLAFILMSIARTDKYNAIKKVCCIDNPIPSQVALVRTLRNPSKLRSVTQKIVLQMNCKLGGTLWQVKVPMKNTMVIGLDTYHDAGRNSNSVGAVVASINESLTRWYSTIYRQDAGRELIDGIEMAVCRCLSHFKEVNGFYPLQIIIFRDGLGDGQLEACSKFEIPQLLRACMKVCENYSPKFLFIVVQKRIQTRLFFEENRTLTNPPPGFIMDHSITRKNMFDFFLVSQNVRQGTVTPTHYVVLHNSHNMEPDKVQRLSYKMTHLYYNWCGTIRVPAPCQYAHKLAYLVGESLHKEADESLSDKLFYL